MALMRTPRKQHQWENDVCVHCGVKRKGQYNSLGWMEWKYYHPKGGTPLPRAPVCYSKQLMMPLK